MKYIIIGLFILKNKRSSHKLSDNILNSINFQCLLKILITFNFRSQKNKIKSNFILIISILFFSILLLIAYLYFFKKIKN